MTLQMISPASCRELTSLHNSYSFGHALIPGTKGLRDYVELEDRDAYYRRLYSFASVRPDPGVTSTLKYDPVLLTIGAGLESARYDIGPFTRIRLELPSEQDSKRFYRKDPAVRISFVGRRAQKLYVLFGSSFSTWRSGTWLRKTIHVIRAREPMAAIVAFEGVFTPEFLSYQPSVVSADPGRAAADLRSRLRRFIRESIESEDLVPNVNVSVLGFSGGANMVIALLAADSLSGDGANIFKSGLALSPVLDATVAFNILDSASRRILESGFPPNKALTVPIFPDLLMSFLLGYGLNPRKYLESSSARSAATPRRRELWSRFYREFTIVDLANVRRSGGPRASLFSHWSDVPGDKARQTLRYLEKIRAPHHLTLIFALDDPVLSSDALQINATPPRITNLLGLASSMPCIKVIAPRYGGHMGYILDPEFLPNALLDLE